MKKNWLIPIEYALGAAAGLSLLYLTSRHNYLLFHSLAEGFSIAVNLAIFMLVWNSRKNLGNGYILILGFSSLSIGALDLAHTLAYQGMGVFFGHGANPATQLWMAARYVQSLSLLIASMYLGQSAESVKLPGKLVLAGYTAVTGLLLWMIFYGGIFPACYIQGVGLTFFKKAGEYIICLIFIVSLILLKRHRDEFDPVVGRWLGMYLVASIFSELTFTLYLSVFGFMNMLGHILKIIAFFFVYKAVVEMGVRQPQALLFRDLRQREEALQKSEELFRTMSDFTYDWEYWLDPEKQFVYISPSCERMTGYRAEDFRNDPTLLTRIIHPDDLAVNITHLGEGMEDSGIHSADFRIITQKGEERWISHICQPVYGRDGKFLGRRAGNRDITAQKQAETTLREAERSLRESEERLRTLINAMPDIICFKDGQGRWLEANDADLRLFELTEVDYRGKTGSEMAAFSPGCREAFLTCGDSDERAWELR
ncbi:MAG: PAS domain S-box protein, partial [Deltaproteobacteria bacterium]|nr:PAS domain S-box protein [Deltaproteobacteria bacterium]